MMDVYTRIHILPDKQDEIKILIEGKGQRLEFQNDAKTLDITFSFTSAEELRAFVARISDARFTAEQEAEND